MRSFTCPGCGQLVFPDNDRCLRCETPLGFRPSAREVVAVDDDATRCANHAVVGCPWLVEDDDELGLCRSCRLTRTRPPAEDADAQASWAEAESAKRRLVFQALELGVDIEGVRFDLLSGEHEPVTTGHADGVITIDVDEADDVVRTRMREQMGEAYRTVLGHMRHEIGHYLWMTLVDGSDRLESCREVFGDERADYGAALEAHYAGEPPADWAEHHVSEYATAHPWEDFAETLAHYLHIRDALQTAGAYGIEVHGDHGVLDVEPAEVDERADDTGIHAIVGAWLPLTYALNAVNRSMGSKALYPFVLAPEVVDKLGWVHELLTDPAVIGAAPTDAADPAQPDPAGTTSG